MSLACPFASRSGSSKPDKYEVLLKNASDGIHILDENGFVLEASNQFCVMLGYSCEEMAGMHVSQWDATHRATELQKAIAEQLSLAEPRSFETRHRRKDGTLIDVEVTGLPVQIQGKWVLFNSARSIAERKATEMALQESLAHQRRLTGFNVLLGEVNQAIARAQDPTSLFQDICDLAVRYTDTRLAWIGRPDTQGDFQVLAAAGETGYLDGIQISSRADLPKGRGTTGIAWREDRPVYVDSIAHPPMMVWADRTVQFGLSSIAALPIHRGGAIWAILKIYPSEENAFPEELHALMEELAKDIGFGLDRIDLTIKEHAANAFNEVLLNNLTAGINVIRFPERIIERVNQRMLEMFGASSAEDLEGHSTLDLYGGVNDYQKVGEFARRVAEQGTGVLRDVPYKRLDGTPLYADVSGQKLPTMLGESERIVWTFVDVTERHQLMEDLSRKSLTDLLTDLPNRRALDVELDRAISRAYRNKKPLAVCMLDLDNFKPVNDTYGHAAGDQVLQSLAKRLRKILRKTDFVARLGGDEFVLLLEGFGRLEQLESILGKLGDSVSEPITLEDGQTVSVGLSMGVCPYPSGQEDVSAALLRQADQALYEAKAHKADRSRFWALYGQPVPRHRNRYQRLLWEGGLMVVYQPIFDTRIFRTVAVEALARLKDENNDILSPAEFLPGLDKADISELSRLVLLQSIDDLQRLDNEHGEEPRLRVSVNLDPSALNDASCGDLRDILAKSPVDPHRITFEVLEYGEFPNTEEVVRWLEELRSLGARIALDDIGSSYSSLLRLRTLPVDEIKLDQGYVRTLAHNPDNLHFITTIQHLAEEYGVDLVVEGVESDDILDALMMLDVTLLQGYALARPMPLRNLREFLKHPPIVKQQHPTTLLGLYADLICLHNVLKRTARKNPSLVNCATLADVSACPATEHLCRLGYPEGGPLDLLHRKYHRSLASGYAQWGVVPNENDCRETKEAQSNLLAATWEEYDLRVLATSTRDRCVNQPASHSTQANAHLLAI